MKVGDKLYCVHPVVMVQSGCIRTTVGKVYEIIEFDAEENEIRIHNDDDREHIFDLDRDSESYYGIWFITDRLSKLQKLNGLHHSEEK